MNLTTCLKFGRFVVGWLVGAGVGTGVVGWLVGAGVGTGVGAQIAESRFPSGERVNTLRPSTLFMALAKNLACWVVAATPVLWFHTCCPVLASNAYRKFLIVMKTVVPSAVVCGLVAIASLVKVFQFTVPVVVFNA